MAWCLLGYYSWVIKQNAIGAYFNITFNEKKNNNKINSFHDDQLKVVTLLLLKRLIKVNISNNVKNHYNEQFFKHKNGFVYYFNQF